MDLVHDRGSVDPVHKSGPWTRSKEEVHGPLVHVLSSPLFFAGLYLRDFFLNPENCEFKNPRKLRRIR